jgi:hypothetical protein
LPQAVAEDILVEDKRPLKNNLPRWDIMICGIIVRLMSDCSFQQESGTLLHGSYVQYVLSKEKTEREILSTSKFLMESL